MAYTQQILDITIWLAIAMAFNYFLVYRKNRFFGNLVFMGVGFLMFYILPSDLLYAGVGFVIISGSIISLVYDVMSSLKARKQR